MQIYAAFDVASKYCFIVFMDTKILTSYFLLINGYLTHILRTTYVWEIFMFLVLSVS